MSAIGITNTIGRIICGAVSSVPGISALAINNIALTIGGLATMFSAYSKTPTFQFIYAAVFGLSICKYIDYEIDWILSDDGALVFLW